ncbi:MAG: hypothetical protein A2Y38_00765 [Spirochaetes bacterium GWB1_59_5]|nr:MAG: hypothetical protein A2Y38_00765 [Spirochaetes bacterium GWB1_59_5]
MSRAGWTQDSDTRYWRRGADPIGVVKSDRYVGWYAPCYVATGEPVGATDTYEWLGTLGEAIDRAEVEQRREQGVSP